MKALLVLALLMPALASAQGFEAMAENAQVVQRLDDIVWAYTAACSAGDDTQQRQCRLVRDKRAKELAGAVLVVDGETAALELTKWSPQKRSLGITVTSCIRCAGLEVEGRKWFVIGSGAAPRFEGTRLRTHVLYDTTQMFKDEASANAFTKSVEHARVQYIVKVPAQVKKWNVGGKDGLSLEIAGYRVIAPCDGTIVASNPPSSTLPPDKQACAGGGAAPIDPNPEGKLPEKLPDALTGAMIKQAMQPVLDAANACFARYKVTGRAKLVMTIDNTGKITDYVQEGELVGTPTATCLDTAVKKITFPPTQKPSTKVGYPIVLR